MVRIITDSTSDLPEEIIKKYNIEILSLHVLLGEDEYLDGVNIDPKMIYKWSDENNSTPKTSAPSIDDAVSIFKPIIDNGDEIIAFSVSKEISTSHNVMKIAAEILEAEDKIHIIDSANLSAGIGLLAIEAACMAQEGKSADQIEEAIIKVVPLVRTSFVVDSLTYLHRGGRCSGITAMAGGMLKLHPLINVTEGRLLPGNKYRGKIQKVIKDYVKDVVSKIGDTGVGNVAVGYSGDLKDIALEIKEEVEKLNIFEDVMIIEAGSVITSHCGPNTFGIFYLLK